MNEEFMNEEKIEEVFSDEGFVKSLMELETPEEAQKALAEKDIDLSVNEIETISKMPQKKAEGELTDDELEDVAGGAIQLLVAIIGTAIAVGAIEVDYRTRRRW